MAKKEVAQLIKEATEAVKGVPDDLRTVAFQKAFDELASEQSASGSTDTPPPAKRRRSTGGGGKQRTPQASDDSNRSQLDRLNRTSHPNITQNASALENSLRLLKAARDELDIDGLTQADIARVLTDKFRCRVTRQSVGRALNGAGRLVDRHKEGKSVIFRIMSAGEDHLSDIDNSETPNAPKPSKKKSKKKKSKQSKTATAHDATKSPSERAVKKTKVEKTKTVKKSSGRPGPKAAVQKLIDDGFFAAPRTNGDIIKHLKDSSGHTYKPEEIAPALLRLLREGALARDRNSDNQYEYTNA